jgi:hypothetical protein
MTVAAAVVDLADLYRPKAIYVDDGGVGGGVAGAEPWSIWAGRGGVQFWARSRLFNGLSVFFCHSIRF